MSAPPSQSTQPTATTFNERLNEQLINCLNVQTNVIQNLSQYSQHISLQLFEIKNIVEMLSNRVLTLQQQQQQQYSQQSHYAPAHYPASYYPNYVPQQPTPMSHPPPPPSHPSSVPFSVQQPAHVRAPTTITTATVPTSSFFSQTAARSSPPLPSNISSFQFSTSALTQPPQHPSMTNSLPPTTTTPSKPFSSNPPKFNIADIATKPPLTFSTATINEKPSNSSPFVFGTSNMTSIFGTSNLATSLPTISSAKPETNADDDGEGGDDDVPYEPDVSFKPIVQLSAVDVKTGEEDENILFCERAKLYRFDADANQMKERGVGEIKILQHKISNVCRILMRREQVLKLCANHQITSQMELKPHQGSVNAFIWSAMDFADGETKHETLCIRFKTEEQAKNFAKAFNDAKVNNTKKSGDLPSIGKISLNDQTKANDDDIISLGEVKPSAEQMDKAKKLQLPSSFYLYENKEPCKGCPGCEDDSPPVLPSENKIITKKPTDVAKNETKTTTTTTTVSQPPSAPKTPLSSSENIKFPFINPDKSQPQVQKQTSTTKDDKTAVAALSPASNATSQYDNKPSIFGNLNGTASSSVFGSSTPLNNSNGSVFGGAPFKPSNNTNGGFSFPGFGGSSTATTPSTGFQFSTPAASSTTTTTTTAPTTTATNTSSTFTFGSTAAPVNKALFGSSPKFTFSDLAKQTPSSSNEKPTSNGTDQRVFAGQGSLIFGTNSVNTTTTGNNNDEDDGEGGGDDESYEPNVSFKPIVQLSAVDVKTGEEDEDVLFCERAKLYRFDAETNQMKERGVGEIKILQQKTSNICRIIMRREQVLKLCANHQITSKMELKPHQGTENAYVWSAMDYADGEAKHETLCIRFKSGDLAKKFVKQFNDAKQANANVQQ